jgi:hypothetical protein
MLPNGLELSCPAARATAFSLSRNLAGKASPTFGTPAGSAAASCYASVNARPVAEAQRSPTLRLPVRLLPLAAAWLRKQGLLAALPTRYTCRT